MRRQLVLTASGPDQAGILEQFTTVIVRHRGNVDASRVVRLGGDFALLMFISAPEERLDALHTDLDRLEEHRWAVSARLSEAEPERDEVGGALCAITVLGADHLGIIHQIARYLAEQGISIDTMNTEVMAAPMSGTPLFTMSAVVRVPPRLTLDDLRDALEFIGEEVGVDTKVFPQREGWED
jgi:glycine cleavage system transcriptional repressor